MIRILSLDGGPGPLMQIQVLLQIEQGLAAAGKPSLIEQVDVFAGTSDGALLSLYFASELTRAAEDRAAKRPAKPAVQIITDAIAFAKSYTGLFGASTQHIAHALLLTGLPLELLMLLGKPAGKRSAFLQQKVQELVKNAYHALGIPFDLIGIRHFLSGRQPLADAAALHKLLDETFGNRKLGELSRKVVVVSFDTESWAPRAYRNFAAGDDYGQKDLERDGKLTLVEVAMATSSLPLAVPVFGGQGDRGYFDGVFSANNPAMTATSLVIRHLVDPHEANPFDKLRVLSLGAHQTAEEANLERRGGLLALSTLLTVDDRDARLFLLPMSAWDRLRYLVSPEARKEQQDKLRFRGVGSVKWGWLDLLSRPTLLGNLLIHGQNDEEARQAQRLLRDNFFRFSPRINLARAMFRLMVLRLPLGETDLGWNADRCFRRLFKEEPPSSDELHNATRTDALLRWIDRRFLEGVTERPAATDHRIN